MDMLTAAVALNIATNALLDTTLSNLSREIERYHLPIQCPLAAQEVARFVPEGEGGGLVEVTNGWRFHPLRGRLLAFDAPAYRLAAHRRVPGEAITVSLEEARRIATNFVALGGFADSETWIRLEPEIAKAELPFVPYYTFEWFKPNEEEATTVRIAVDGRDGSVTYADFNCLFDHLNAGVLQASATISRPMPKSTNDPPPKAVEQSLLSKMAREILTWRSRLGLPPGLLDGDWGQSHLCEWRRFPGKDGQPDQWNAHVSTNGWELYFCDGKLVEWDAPDIFFGVAVPPDLERLGGKWRLSERQSIDLARQALRDLAIRKEGMKVISRAPRVQKPRLHGSLVVPRYRIEWRGIATTPDGQYSYIDSWIRVEVDADRKVVKSLSIYLAEDDQGRIIVH